MICILLVMFKMDVESRAQGKGWMYRRRSGTAIIRASSSSNPSSSSRRACSSASTLDDMLPGEEGA